MRKHAIILLSLVLLLAACQPTPDKEFVVNKNDGALETILAELPVESYEADATSPEARTLKSLLGVPERVADAFTTKVYGGTLDVSIDAALYVPEVGEVPVFDAEIGWNAMHDRTEIAHALLGDEIYEITDSAGYYTNKYEIAYYTEWLSELNEGSYRTDDPEGELYTVKANLDAAADAMRRYANVPEPTPWDGTFGKHGQMTILWRDPCLLEFYEADGIFQWILYQDVSVIGYGISNGKEPKPDEDREAIELAQSFLKRITDCETEAFSVENTYDGKYIALSIKRAGIPSVPLRHRHGDDMGYDAVNGQEHQRKMRPEAADVYVVDGEVKRFQWQSTLYTTGTENQNVALLPFSEILDIFRTHIRTAYYLNYDERDGSEARANMYITAIRFSYLRVDRKDSDGYYLLPVWDFCGWDEYVFEDRDPEAASEMHAVYKALADWNSTFLTVNAIDGSIIDRDLGY